MSVISGYGNQSSDFMLFQMDWGVNGNATPVAYRELEKPM